MNIDLFELYILFSCAPVVLQVFGRFWPHHLCGLRCSLLLSRQLLSNSHLLLIKARELSSSSAEFLAQHSMTIEVHLCYRDLLFSCLDQRSLDFISPDFRRTCSAPSSLSIGMNKINDVPTWTEHGNRGGCKDMKEDDICAGFVRSKSSIDSPDIKDISNIFRTIRSDDLPVTGDSSVAISSCSLMDSSLNDSKCRAPALSAHDLAVLGMSMPSHRPNESIELVTWNLASPNNNPFEFWVRNLLSRSSCFSSQ
jgi:hypothetical protein